MYCQNRIVHTIQSGDSLYKLSRQYKTTVTELILGNPGVNPYNLQVGMELMVCPGAGYDGPGMGNTGNMGSGSNTGIPGNMGSGNPGMPGNMGNGSNAGMPGNMGGSNSGMPGNMGGGNNTGMPGNPVDDNAVNMCRGVMELDQNMRLAWLSHVYWARMYLMSALSDSPDQQEVEERLLETADEITNVFADFLSSNATRQLRNLLTEHIEIAGEIIHALKAGNMENYDGLIKEWYSNANQIANLLGAQNPYFSGRETRNMLLKHLDLEREGIEHQVNGEYSQSIDTFRDTVDQAVQMADFFARGLLAR